MLHLPVSWQACVARCRCIRSLVTVFFLLFCTLRHLRWLELSRTRSVLLELARLLKWKDLSKLSNQANDGTKNQTGGSVRCHRTLPPCFFFNSVTQITSLSGHSLTEARYARSLLQYGTLLTNGTLPNFAGVAVAWLGYVPGSNRRRTNASPGIISRASLALRAWAVLKTIVRLLCCTLLENGRSRPWFSHP